MFRYLPEQASDFAHNVDNLNNWITDISVFFTVLIVGTMIYFAIKYRKKNGVDHQTPRIEGSHLLEVVWTVVPTIICIVIAYYGFMDFKKLREVPANPLEINVVGKQWSWSFTYANGKNTTNEFTVPVGRPVKLILTSTDVLHSFFVPGMRTKMDAVPGFYTYQWFRPIKTGPQQVYCTEYCGTSHSQMLAKMNVVSESEYEAWVNAKDREISDPIEAGKKLYVEKGCNACHSTDGKKVVGPSFLNLFGKQEMCEGGSSYLVDENYIRESILNPKAKVVLGYPGNVMPSQEGAMTDEQIGKIIAFIKSLKSDGTAEEAPAAETIDLKSLSPSERGKIIYTNNACIGCHSLDGSKVVGPSFKALYGKTATYDEGKSYVADDAYLKESILNSNAHIVDGYPKPSPMPKYEGLLTEDQISDVIEFIKTAK